MNRRSFLQTAISIGASTAMGSLLSCTNSASPTRTSTNFFKVSEENGHWWLITPEGKPFFSIGINHIDPASLRYPENIHIWREKYQGRTTKWLQESVSKNLKEWGFNTVGWEQEVTVRRWRHSRSFTLEEYQALNMPYCHMLPFTESHQWEQHTRHFDFFSSEWEEWCDYVARSHCAEMSEDPNLIGYFYSDCPTWVHDRPTNQWRGPIFDPERLKTEEGKKELFQLAKRYYQTTHDAIRRYDKNHLILGDRYEANEPVAMEVVEAALPYVDILSFQDFRDPVNHLQDWHQKTGKPVLLADAARIKWQTVPGEFTYNNGNWYTEVLSQLIENPGCIGFHLCGAYQRNKARRYGLLDEYENPDEENVALIQEANFTIQKRMKEMIF
ncbi:MAG: agarase [Bacteroidota bacterium]